MDMAVIKQLQSKILALKNIYGEQLVMGETLGKE